MKFIFSVSLFLSLTQGNEFYAEPSTNFDSMLGRFLSEETPTYHLPNRDDLTRKEKKHIKNSARAAMAVLDLNKNGEVSREEALKVFKSRLIKKPEGDSKLKVDKK